MIRNKLIALHLTLLFGFPMSANAQSSNEKVLNLYSARHYQTDEALYSNFTKATGIKINRIEADDNGDRLFFDEECFIRQQDGVGRFKVDNLAPVAGIGVIANSRDEAKSIQSPEVSLQDLTKRITFL